MKKINQENSNDLKTKNIKRKASHLSNGNSKKKNSKNNDLLKHDTKKEEAEDSKPKKIKLEKKQSSLKFDSPSLIKKGHTKNVDNDTEKPNWTELRKKKKDLKEKRKAKKLVDIYETSIQAKKLGEKLRVSKCTPRAREELIKKIHKLLLTRYNKIIFMHDMSRIIQWVFKYGNAEIRSNIFDEIESLLVSVLESKYGKNCIKCMLKHGTQELRSKVISACFGNVVKLMSNTVSAPVIELAYSLYATDENKIFLMQEFYGDMYKGAKDKNVKALSDVYKNATDMKSATLTAVKGNLIKILNKNIIDSTLLQSVLLEFLNNCSNDSRSELIVTLRNLITELSQTKIGAKVAAICIWHGTNKDRKIIMKSLKGNVKAISMSEHGYMILLALIDSVDDTVIMKKIVLSEIQQDLTEIALNEYGKHVILYFVARRDPHYFSPSIIDYLKQGDNNLTSKKPADVREKELLEFVTDSFLETVRTETSLWLSNGSIAMITLAILKVGSGEKLELALKSIVEFITNPGTRIKEKDTEYNPVEYCGLHMMLKKLIQYDKNFESKGETTFGTMLINESTTDILKAWIQFNRGCFLIVLLIENNSESIVNDLLSKLKKVSHILKNKESPGARILREKIKQK